MAYIWNDYSAEKEYRLIENTIVPNAEVWDTLESPTLVNVMPRLFDLVFPYSAINNMDSLNVLYDKYLNDPEYQNIFDLMMHFQATLDLNSGAGIRDIVSRLTEKAVLDGGYGDEIRELYMRCDRNVRYMLLDCRSEYILSGSKKDMFERFISLAFRKINIYYQKSTAKTYIYVDLPFTDERQSITQLAEYFLSDLHRETEFMWKGEHLPFIGTDFTTILGSIYLG